MITPGAMNISSRNKNGGPLTSHLVRRAAVRAASYAGLAMQKHPGIMPPADLDRIARFEQLGAPRRGIRQQRFDHYRHRRA